MDTILVPTDGSNFSELAYPIAVSLALAIGSSLTPLMVTEETTADPEADSALVAHCHALVERSAEQLGASVAPSCHPQMRVGDPAAEIRRAVTESVRYIAMTTHGRSGFQRMRLGSVADAVLRNARVPTVVVCPDQPPAAKPLRGILVPLDGSRLAEAALDEARTLASQCGASITIVRAVPRQERLFLFDGTQEEIDASTLEEPTAYMESVAASFAPLTVRQVVAIADPAELIRAEAGGNDLIVMGSRGRRGVPRLALGSVSNEVVRTNPTPVMIVRRARSDR